MKLWQQQPERGGTAWLYGEPVRGLIRAPEAVVEFDEEFNWWRWHVGRKEGICAFLILAVGEAERAMGIETAGEG